MKRRINKMNLEEPYGAIVANKEGLEVEVKAQGFFAGYANTWDGMKADANKLAESVRRPKLTEGSSEGSSEDDDEEEEETHLRLVEGED